MLMDFTAKLRKRISELNNVQSCLIIQFQDMSIKIWKKDLGYKFTVMYPKSQIINTFSYLLKDVDEVMEHLDTKFYNSI